jgi:hypothetical protein
LTAERWRLRCAQMPVGHWHCQHGHLADCPRPMSCRKVDNWWPATFVVEAGPTVWLFADEAAARRQVDVLYNGGAQVRYRPGLTPQQLAQAMRRLPPYRRTIEDCRSVATRRAFFPVSVIR